MSALPPLIEYRAVLEGNRQIFWLNNAPAFHAFAAADENFARINAAAQTGRDENNKTRVHVIPLLLLMQRQLRSAFDLLTTYRGYEAWVVARPAIELALLIGKFEDDVRFFKIWEDRQQDWRSYRDAFSGQKLRSTSLPRSADIQIALKRINDDFVHANPTYFERRFGVEAIDQKNIGFKIEYTDDDESLGYQLWSFLHLVVVVQQSIADLLNSAFTNADVKIATLTSFEKQYPVQAPEDDFRRMFLKEIGLWDLNAA